jgi:PleD family two-component response regulator
MSHTVVMISGSDDPAFAFANPSSPSPRGRVLLVDADRSSRDALSTALVESRLEVVSWTGPGDPVNAVHQERPDLILVSANLPGQGRDALDRALEEDRRTRDIPVVLYCSGSRKDRTGQSASACFFSRENPRSFCRMISRLVEYLSCTGSPETIPAS